jgi:NAD(P)H-nitrite reductase large subunit
MENKIVCNCMQVYQADIERVLASHEKFSDVVSAFDEIQFQTHCSTGCGGCHDKVMDLIADYISK